MFNDQCDSFHASTLAFSDLLEDFVVDVRPYCRIQSVGENRRRVLFRGAEMPEQEHWRALCGQAAEEILQIVCFRWWVCTQSPILFPLLQRVVHFNVCRSGGRPESALSRQHPQHLRVPLVSVRVFQMRLTEIQRLIFRSGYVHFWADGHELVRLSEESEQVGEAAQVRDYIKHRYSLMQQLNSFSIKFATFCRFKFCSFFTGRGTECKLSLRSKVVKNHALVWFLWNFQRLWCNVFSADGHIFKLLFVMN